MPTRFATTAVQATITVVKQFRKGEISKIEAILDIQAALTSGEDKPFNEELVSMLLSYINILDNIQQSSEENRSRRAASSSQVPRAPKLKAPIQHSSSSPTSSSKGYAVDLSKVLEPTTPLCYNSSFLFLHHSSDHSLSYWTNFSPSFEDALRLNLASLASRRAWLCSSFPSSHGCHPFSCVTSYTASSFSIARTILPLISVLAFPLQTLLGLCAGSPLIYMRQYHL